MKLLENNDTETSLESALRAAGDKVAPVWPLESFVAVNPYMGLMSQKFGTAADRLRRVAGARATMPAAFYLERLDAGEWSLDDLDAALRASGSIQSASELVASARDGAFDGAGEEPTVGLFADAARSATGTDWSQLLIDRVSQWAAAFFDEGQAEWRPPAEGVYASWRAEAELDRTPEIMGVPNFRAHVASLPRSPLGAATSAVEELGIPEEALDFYLHALLMRLGGWAAYAARIVWDRKLYESAQDDALLELACVLLSFEAALSKAFGASAAATEWKQSRERMLEEATATNADERLSGLLLLQEAFERGAHRLMVERFDAAAAAPQAEAARPNAQAIFCIDVRSEVYRRHLEACDAHVETMGFAGFFGFPVEMVPLGHDHGGTQCPVLLTPAATVSETLPDASSEVEAVRGRKLTREVSRAWQSFKMGAVSCFSFVGPVGLAYLPKLFSDAFGWTRPVRHPDVHGLSSSDAARATVSVEQREIGGRTVGIDLATRIEMAAGALGAMSLTKDFARIVALVGHGSSTVNNPHATGLDCGACGGRTGEANARVAATILNQPEVRAGLAEKGINVPDDTWFLACQHDTTTDEVAVFDEGAVPASHKEDLAQLEASFAKAGNSARVERAPRLGASGRSDLKQAILQRSRDWAQVRPEWGLAGCSAFVVAPRTRTKALGLDGRAFLHSYVWEQDSGFGVLELIMTAPMVVASWISLQYYASTVENRIFGSGDKTLHNVVGTVGVLEGNAGDLRVGLPMQSVHDGERVQHDPMRLNVVIEAPLDAMNRIIEKHAMVRDLLDNGWLNLWALDADGKIAHRYAGGLEWTDARTSATVDLPHAASA